MKTLLTASAIAASLFAGAAIAQSSAEVEIGRYIQDFDATGLSDAQLGALVNVIHTNESYSETQSTLNSLLRQYR
ncbi:hypothetical protein [Roseivivax sp. CAU 1761]